MGRGVGPARSGGRKKKKMKGRREGRWLGSTASGGRGGLELGREDEGMGLGWRGGGKEKKNLKRRR